MNNQIRKKRLFSDAMTLIARAQALLLAARAKHETMACKQRKAA